MSEIIIDDVNVEECSYYNKDNAPYCCEVWDNECEAQNCYYKQLKRLQAENFELKESLKVFRRPDIQKVLTLYKVGDIDLLEQKCERLEQENKELKELKCKFKEYCTCDTERLQAENERLKKRQITKNGFICDCEQNVKYRQALEEIREMCSNTCEKNKDCIHSCYECKSIDEPTAINRILKIISEVLDERN